MLWVGNDCNIEVLGLENEDGGFVTDATIICTITDPNNVTVATLALVYRGAGISVTVGGATYLDGNYRATLPASNSPALVAGTTYKLVYAASNYGFAMTHFETAQTRIG